MARRPVNPHAVISLRDAERAIYIDCEGFQEQSPVLLGIQIHDATEQVVLDPVLEPVARARHHRMSSFVAEVSRLVELSQIEQRPIVAYSQHERNVILKFTHMDIGDHYRDARMIANRWKNALHRGEPLGGKGLKAYLAFIGYERGSHLGNRKSTKRIREVRDMIARRGTYDALTPVKKAHWTNLLEHNRIDCDGMRELVIRAAGELESRQHPR